jgi:hypothetical protein
MTTRNTDVERKRDGIAESLPCVVIAANVGAAIVSIDLARS